MLPSRLLLKLYNFHAKFDPDDNTNLNDVKSVWFCANQNVVLVRLILKDKILITGLSIEKLEALGKALLDFSNRNDLQE